MPVSLLSEHLSKFGFSAYESRAYLALLKNNPSTGYELAKNSGIPPSKVYEVIQRLLEKSVITPVQGAPVKYVPQDSAALLKKIQDDVNASLGVLRKKMPVARSLSGQHVWDIKGREELLRRAAGLIRSARREILLFCWDEEVAELLPALRKRKKARLVIVQHGDRPVDTGVVYHHRLLKEKREEKGGREFTLVTDGRDLLQAVISDQKENIGVWTQNESLVEVARDFIRHDIYCWKLINRCGATAKKYFGPDFRRLRNIYSK